ncbi:curli-like amyloid fiber formation chaperone CsgH [Oricola sp.]|uniref:curli-like amyloid fiber formation chaperone CsgH n=1 Tax=Oricola sp. TaxID=1979950 RepID=UPI003BA859C7
MKHTTRLLLAGVAAAIAGVAVAGAATTMVTGQDGPVRCEIEADTVRGATRLTGIVHTDTSISGTYRFKVEGGGRAGRSNISQGGAFAAEPGDAFRLGQVMVGNNGGVHDATLELNVMGTTYSCDAHIGAI